MPYHLEVYPSKKFPMLGHQETANKHSKKAIVVNSITGEHKSLKPIPIEKAEAQERILEAKMHNEK